MSLYLLRELGQQPNGSVEYVNNNIIIAIDGYGSRLILDLSTARLLAKRILQCLEDTK